MPKNTDIHTHSYYSDGLLSPTEVVRIARQKHIRNLALTDHNTVAGVEEAVKEGKRLEINIIPGVEIRVQGDEVLGYYIDIHNRSLNNLLKKIRTKVENKMKNRCAILQGNGIDIDFKEIQKEFPYARGNINEFYPYFMYVKKGYGDFFEGIRKIKQICKNEEEIRNISPETAIRGIIKAGGVPVLAHPWVEPRAKGLLEDDRFESLVNAGLKGIEIDNGDWDERRDEKTIKRIRYLAKKYNLVITSGSDFHRKPMFKSDYSHQIGMCNCDDSVVKQLKGFMLS